jgi:hypothetical protein
MVRRHVPDAVAARLDRVHLHCRKVFEDVGHVFELRPVVLDVLTGAEVPVAAVVALRNEREHAKLPGGQDPIRNGHSQHRRMALDVQAVLKAQRAELVLGQFAGEKAVRLIAKLPHALVDDPLIDHIVLVHDPRVTGEGWGVALRRGRAAPEPEGRSARRAGWDSASLAPGLQREPAG